MAKIDKSKYSKQEFKKLQEQKKLLKIKNSLQPLPIHPKDNINEIESNTTAFVVGNGVSRRDIPLKFLKNLGPIYGCNALYREFNPDFLIAVDVKMIIEINRAGYQNKNEVWTNPNRMFEKMEGFNFFHPSKGWSSGPTALWLAAKHNNKRIFILGFDYKGLDAGKKFNNIYADSPNYKKSSDNATFFGNWMRQTRTVIFENPNIEFIRIIEKNTYCPEELEKLDNYYTLEKDKFFEYFRIM